MEKIIQISDCSKSFGSGRSRRKVLDCCSFSAGRNRLTAVIGRSGSGKTTLLNLIAGMLEADEGIIEVDGIRLSELNRDQLADYRSGKIGFVFQDFALLSDYTVRENICFAGDLLQIPYSERFLNELLEKMELSELQDRYPDELSGGEKQKTAIARALLLKPALVLADEPTGNLDRKSSAQVFSLLKECSRLYHQSILMVTHDLSLARQADDILLIEDGRIYPYE